MGQILSEGFACINSSQPPCCYHRPILQTGNRRLKVHAGIGRQSWDSNQAVFLQSLGPEPLLCIACLHAGCMGETGERGRDAQSGAEGRMGLRP